MQYVFNWVNQPLRPDMKHTSLSIRDFAVGALWMCAIHHRNNKALEIIGLVIKMILTE